MITRTQDRIFDTLRDTRQVYLSMKTKFTLRKELQETSKDGKSPIYLHVTAGGKRERINTQLRVKSDMWIEEKQRANPVDKEHQDLNLMLDNILSKLTNIRTVYRLQDIVLHANKLKSELTSEMSRVNFVSFMCQTLEEDKVFLKPGTYRRYTAIVNKLKAYRTEVLFTDLNEEFFKRYRTYLKKLGNKDTTINSNIKGLKKYLRIALKMGIRIPTSLEDIKGGHTNGNRTCLNPEEVKLLIDHYYNGELPERNRLALGYFLFACMSGLRISDIQQLSRENMKGKELSFVTVKTDRGQILSLNNSAVKILEHMDNLFVEHIERNTINRWMQDIAEKLNINKHVSYHVARHTFATNFLRSGGNIHNLMQLMGHKRIDTTMIYVHILAEEANQEIHLLDKLFI